ncbi:hypothetical protein DACRYDRAFT_108753 [Dacryopinax primogenitus]|uniref:Uncharacterized protein n=1 Tax=Dacryopinax primogenitus (strain DJM 731) TaxID=1858805 RepID=M5FT21_DACPD|nr:uncharacterized protein DACRYDRAFT_108753 [Dacryopinax primogenitus]EJU00686.1 hypothetical protein DACRYDRAFT_108753 [Dacryopinax primogenitus]
MLFTSVVALALMPFMVQAAAIRKRSEALLYIEAFEDSSCNNLKDFLQVDNYGNISQSFSGSRGSFRVIMNQGVCGVTLYTTNGYSVDFPTSELQPGACFGPSKDDQVSYLVYTCD